MSDDEFVRDTRKLNRIKSDHRQKESVVKAKSYIIQKKAKQREDQIEKEKQEELLRQKEEKEKFVENCKFLKPSQKKKLLKGQDGAEAEG